MICSPWLWAVGCGLKSWDLGSSSRGWFSREEGACYIASSLGLLPEPVLIGKARPKTRARKRTLGSSSRPEEFLTLHNCEALKI